MKDFIIGEEIKGEDTQALISEYKLTLKFLSWLIKKRLARLTKIEDLGKQPGLGRRR